MSDRKQRRMRGQTGAGIAAITDSARISAGRHRQFDGARNRSLRPEHTSRPGIDTNLRRNVPTVDPAQ